VFGVDMFRKIFCCLYLLIFIPRLLVAFESYDVLFEGDVSPELLCLLKTTSQLVVRQNSPPSTAAGLRHRAEGDIEKLLQALHSQAYYNATVDFFYDFACESPIVTVKVNTGPVYPFGGFVIAPLCGEEDALFNAFCLDDVGVVLGNPALPEIILKAEEILLNLLEKKGYPLATINKREVMADQAVQAIYVTLTVDSGKQTYFGPTKIIGNCSVRDPFFARKLWWSEGCVYDPCQVERTQNAIEASGLFSSIAITHADQADEYGVLPMQLEVIEGTHHSIGWGLTYATHRGAGLTAEWEHRNIRGMGERLKMDMDLWYDDQEAHILYVKPDYLMRAQDLLFLAEIQHQTTKGYTESSFSLSSMIERQVHQNTRISYGLMYKWLKDTRSFGNGEYNLFKIPLQARWSNVNNLLDPTRGHTVNLKVIPTLQFLNPQFAYCINTVTLTAYRPITEDEKYVLAAKFMLGSIWGSSRRTIPSSERFYEGSESSLRGYHYQTVSPLRDCNKPIGGRSMMINSFELRVRATESFGWVAFYEFGNVYEGSLPEIDHKLLHSVGWGIRYHTPVGPLRLDFAVPLNRRKELDPRFQVYVSIGQAF